MLCLFRLQGVLAGGQSNREFHCALDPRQLCDRSPFLSWYHSEKEVP
jgi:hypothetical protein